MHLIRTILGAIALLLFTYSALIAQTARSAHEQAVLAVVQQFESGLRARDLSRIERVVADDLVAFENGHRNDGWPDFRDNHLVPEMKDFPPPSRNEVIRVSATPNMGWAYTQTKMTLTRRLGKEVEATLWSIYVVEKRAGQWKLTMLDWSMHVPPPSK